MRVQVRLYGGLAVAAGWRNRTLAVPDGAAVLDLLRVCAEQYPGLARFVPARPDADLPDYLLVLVDGHEASGGFRLQEGAQVLLALPSTGGGG